MSTDIHPLAGTAVCKASLINIDKLIGAYYDEQPDYSVIQQRVIFGTSGHRGSSFNKTFNENHIIAITQAILLYRSQHNITGPIFLGIDTHALSVPAFRTVIEVLVANATKVFVSKNHEYTPTPAISRAILNYNHGRKQNLADGMIITPSHNPPGDGGIKYNPPHGGPANLAISLWIEKKANEFLEKNIESVARIPFERAITCSNIDEFDYLKNYVESLDTIIDINLIRDVGIRIGVDPMGGAGVHYWNAIAEYYALDMTVVNETIDPTFGFMTYDWDGQIRTDPSSPYSMAGLVKLKEAFDVAFGCDADYDRHGIVTRSVGLMPPNHYLSVAAYYLLQHRPQWLTSKKMGKTIVTTNLLDRIVKKLGYQLYEVPVGFKWFVDGLFDQSIAFACEESAGASFSCMDGKVWTTDKDGIALALLSAEITAGLNCDLGQIYQFLEAEFGDPVFKRIDVALTAQQKIALQSISEGKIQVATLADEPIQSVMTSAPGNGASIGGIKVSTQNAWFAIRPSGTEPIYRIYAESFLGLAHLERVILEAQKIVKQIIGS